LADTKEGVADRFHSYTGIGVGGRRAEELRWLVEGSLGPIKPNAMIETPIVSQLPEHAEACALARERLRVAPKRVNSSPHTFLPLTRD
jgi:hypothetical protein